MTLEGSVATRVLVLGGNGMLGHKVFQILKKRFPQSACTLRGTRRSVPAGGGELFRNATVFDGVGPARFSALKAVLDRFRPDLVINCIGLMKQRAEAESAELCTAVNGDFPRELAEATRSIGARLILFSTDCVFSGRKGGYREEDLPDAQDAYGISKYRGEVIAPHVLTLRTSFIGRELSHSASLLEWFLGQRGHSVKGYTRAYFSGVTTNYLGQLLVELIEGHSDLSGLYHLAGERISKHALLLLLRSAFGLKVEIVPDDSVQCDRSLVGERFLAETGIRTPAWTTLAEDLASDRTPYDIWRRVHETA